MSALTNQQDPTSPIETPTSEASAAGEGWQLSSLTTKHKEVAALLAQGIDRKTIAEATGWTPEYISMLARQPLIRNEVRAMTAVAEIQLEGHFVKSVQAIGEVLESGTAKERIQAARLQMEATRRIGSDRAIVEKVVDSNARLTKLAEKLLYLQGNSARLINGDDNG